MNRIKIFQQVISILLAVMLLKGCSEAQPEPTAAVSVKPEKNQGVEQVADEFLVPSVEEGNFSGSVLIALY